MHPNLNTLIGLSLLGWATGAHAGTFTSDFNGDTNAPPGTMVNGSTFIDVAGGVGGSGVLKLTRAINSQSGSFVVSDLDGGAPVYGFDLTAKVRLGGGTSTPADGFSINFDPTAAPETTTGEEGTSGGITFAFDIYDNGSENPPAPSIDLKVGGALVATHKMSIADFDTGTGFADLHITVGADGLVSLAWKGGVLFTNVSFPNYEPLSGASFVFGARTGGANENQWIDDLSITTFTQPKVGIAQQPASATVVAGQTVQLAVVANNAEAATYQWFKDGAALTGQTQPTLTLPSVMAVDSGAKYRVTVTGPNNAVTSEEVTLTVKDLPLPGTPQVSYNFNNGQVPAEAILGGLAAVAPNGGVGDSGVLQLTYDQPDYAGALVIPDPAAGAAVYGFTVEFDVLLRSAATPADGFSLSFGSDVPDDPTLSPSQGLEQGTGTGVVVSFDIYDNGGGEAPAIDVIYKNQTVASKKLPISSIMTGDTFAHAIIRLENDGTIDVVYDGVFIHDNVPIPGFASVSSGRFALAARTGGSSADQWIDNLEITTDTSAGSLRFVTPPERQIVVLGRPATFAAEVNDPTGVTYQWSKNGSPIAGANASAHTTPATTAADSGARFTVTATKGNLTATSDEVTLTVLDLSSPTLSFNFDNGATPPGAGVFGNDTTIAGYITTTGGVNDSGVLHLTDAVNSASGSLVISPLLGGAEIAALTAAFDIRVGGGTAPPADGFSFNFAPGLPDAAGIGDSEDGTGGNLTVGFDIYDNGATEAQPAPSIDLRYKGAVVSTVHLTYEEMETGDAFRPVIIRVTQDGIVDVVYGDRVVFDAVQLPNYTPVAGAKIGIYARTGGLNANMWLDNMTVLAVKSTAPLRITQEPPDIAVMPGQTATFTVGVSDPTGVSYQWLRNGAAIANATSDTYTTSALALGDDATITVQVQGPGGSVTSRAAALAVVPPITISNPKFSANFDDGGVPPGAQINGSASTFNGDGILHLTDAENSLSGSIVIEDFDAGQAVNGFTAVFSLRVGGGSVPPADGLSFVWVNDLPLDTVFGEDGSGTGLVISFDIYDNGNETPPAPSIDARYNGALAGTVQLPFAEMETGDGFEDFKLRVEPDGTLDLQFENRVIFHNVKLPEYTSMEGASFGIGARTGGLNENQWVDNLQITTTLGTVTPGAEFTSITRNAAGQIVIQWTGGGTLQSTDSLSAPNWTAVAGGSSPYTVAPGATGSRFYRIQQ
ncbi:MAG: hypothetical protein AB9869_30035 [Verrucomicrobiia bacterium]